MRIDLLLTSILLCLICIVVAIHFHFARGSGSEVL